MGQLGCYEAQTLPTTPRRRNNY